MAGGQHAGGNARLHGLGQLQQAQSVGDLRPRPAEALSELLLGDAEVFEQLLVRARLLQCVQLGAVKILEQSIPQHRVVGSVAHDRRNRLEAGNRGCSQPSLAHDQLVLRLAGGRCRALAHDDRLQNAELTHRVHELGELIFSELGARLLRVGHDVARRDRGEPGTGHRSQLCRVDRSGEEHIDGALALARGDQSADAATETGALGGGHQAALPRRAISAAASRYDREPGEPSS